MVVLIVWMGCCQQQRVPMQAGTALQISLKDPVMKWIFLKQ